MILFGDFEFRCYGFLCDLLAAPEKVHDDEQTLISRFSLVGAGNDPASKITDTLAITRAPAGNRF